MDYFQNPMQVYASMCHVIYLYVHMCTLWNIDRLGFSVVWEKLPLQSRLFSLGVSVLRQRINVSCKHSELFLYVFSCGYWVVYDGWSSINLWLLLWIVSSDLCCQEFGAADKVLTTAVPSVHSPPRPRCGNIEQNTHSLFMQQHKGKMPRSKLFHKWIIWNLFNEIFVWFHFCLAFTVQFIFTIPIEEV